jgi:hypothetical protein
MPCATGPFKVLEKINDNAYKLELPPEFGVSPTFNILDLKPYLGEEDELESRTTPTFDFAIYVKQKHASKSPTMSFT